MSLSYARVVEVLPKQGGIRVQFTDAVYSGAAQNDFVRVLTSRMSAQGGAALWLPEVGELGVVGETIGGNLFWMGSLPFQDENQVDPTPGIGYWRHASGVVFQVRKEGSWELMTPSGFRISCSKDGSALPELEASSSPDSLGDTDPPVLHIEHPSGAIIEIDADGNGKFSGFTSMDFQEGGKRFAMEALVDWCINHTHTSASSGSPTSPPVVLPTKDGTCSPTTFTGPQGT